MADQKKWFKAWTTLLIDSLSMPVEDIGRFTVLGCLIASRGDNGILVTDRKALHTLLQCKEIPPDFIKNFNIEITEIEGSCNGGLSVTMKNWNKYQIDSTGYERQQRYREAHSVTAKVTAKVTAQEKRREEKRRVDKIRVDKKEKTSKRETFHIPPLKEITDYCLERKNNVNPKTWLNHYEAKGWMIGKSPMKDWKAAIRTWEDEKPKGEQLADKYKPL